MANSKLVFTISSILLVLTFFNLSFSTLGRPLMKTENKLEYKPTYENIVRWHRNMLENEAVNTLVSHNSYDGVEGEKLIDDFRPTDPGHSPGAGHSTPTIPMDTNVPPKA
ncbi:unnamed protein product [Trifolium pratense]|uniref:Uncharacterized protein n=1 Tax=Trifolium pratense TaxID=57577 RepID=A0ACB0M7U1_TRIPR|nr:unnamed protein product [Trifolium pratense]